MSISSIDGASVVYTARSPEREELATAVVEAIAVAEGVDPTDLDVRIGDVVDPDALNTLFGSVTDRSGRFVFRLAGYLVRLSANREITLYRA